MGWGDDEAAAGEAWPSTTKQTTTERATTEQAGAKAAEPAAAAATAPMRGFIVASHAKMREFVVAHLPEAQGVDRPAAVEVSGSRLSQVHRSTRDRLYDWCRSALGRACHLGS